MTTILVTGGAGFIGSSLAISFKRRFPKTKVICLDNLKRRGSELNLKRLSEVGIEFIHGDVRNKEDLELQEKIDCIIECSAEPSVLAGTTGSPAYLIESNLLGAVNCLELARKHKSDFIFLSTSRVYPYDTLVNLPLRKGKDRFSLDSQAQNTIREGIGEDYPLFGVRSLYGATKLAAEYLILEYAKTYGLRIIINRCGVIAGPWQMARSDQGVFSLWVARHVYNKPLKYIGFGGTGHQVRDLLHIDDLCDLVIMQITKRKLGNGKIFNVGGGIECSLSLRETTRLCSEITGNKVPISPDKKTRPGDIPYYVTNNDKITNEFGWKPKRSPKDIIVSLYNWIKNNEQDLRGILH